MTNDLLESKYDQPCSVNDGIELRKAILAHEYASNSNYTADLQEDINNLIESIVLDYCFAKEQIRRNILHQNSRYDYELSWLVAGQYKTFPAPISYAKYVFGQSGERNFLMQCFKYDDTMYTILMEFFYIAWTLIKEYIGPNHSDKQHS
jgi:hypothetical protein